MDSDIRKISIGKDYPDGAMHYQVGSRIRLKQIPYVISEIRLNKSQGSISYDVYITNEEGTILWKSISDMPIVVEKNIDFD